MNADDVQIVWNYQIIASDLRENNYWQKGDSTRIKCVANAWKCEWSHPCMQWWNGYISDEWINIEQNQNFDMLKWYYSNERFRVPYCVLLVHVRDREVDKLVGFRCSMKNKLPINFKASLQLWSLTTLKIDEKSGKVTLSWSKIVASLVIISYYMFFELVN